MTSRRRRLNTATAAGVAAGVAIATASGLLAGCSGPRSGSSAVSAVGGCATVLPLSRERVGDGPTLVSVHALRGHDLTRYLDELGAPSAPSAGPAPDPAAGHDVDGPPRVCLVVYQGTFPDDVVQQAPPGSSGRYAFLFVEVRHPRVRTVLLGDELPAALRKS